jgi:hypothetical protein
MKNEDDHLLEKLLREGFEGPVPDDGFSERLMRRLPRRRRSPAWLSTASACIGATACWLSLSSAPMLNAGWNDWLHGQASHAAFGLLLVLAIVSLMSLGWTLVEAD